MSSIYRFDTTTTPITMYEVDNGRLDPETLKANEVLTLNADRTISLVKTTDGYIETRTYTLTPDLNDDPADYQKTSELYALPDGTPITRAQAEALEQADDYDRDGSNDDHVDGHDSNDIEHGGRGNDTLNGGLGDDDLQGEDDNDHLDGGNGADHLDGGRGHDDVRGGDGDDTVSGGDGNDHLFGQSASGGIDGDDVINGNEGSDYIQGNAGNDSLSGGDGSDRINGGADDDTATGDGGNDLINGNLGDDSIDGGIGNDILRGGKGDDSLSGGAGDDRLSGDLGVDTLTGGGGEDDFLFAGGAAIFSSTAPDVLTDFENGIDELNIGFEPVTVLTGASQADFTAAAGLAQRLFDANAGNREVAAIGVGADSYLFYASDGGAIIDSSIKLTGIGASAIDVGDFG